MEPLPKETSPYKQGKYLPGSHIPVVSEEKIREFQPDYIIIFPWNLKNEIVEQLKYISEWGGKVVTFIPDLQIHTYFPVVRKSRLATDSRVQIV
jgi:hypothetical protein